MRTEIVAKGPVEVTLKVFVPAEEVDKAFEGVITSLSRTARIPGFRPGRIPRGVLEKRLGADALKEEAKEKLLDDNYASAMSEHEFAPINAHFHAAPPERGQEYSFEIHAELYPTVALTDLSTLSIESQPKQMDDDMLSQAIKQLQRENAVLVPVDRPVEADDWVLIETVPERADGDTTEGAENPSTFPVDLETAGEELRSQLIGATIGQTVDVVLTDEVVPDEEGEPTKRTLHLKVHDVKAKEKPEPGEEFAKQLGLDSWQEVEDRVKESIAADLSRSGYQERRTELIDKLVDGSTLDLPPSLVRRRQQSMLEDLVADLRRQGQTFDSYLARLDARNEREQFEAELLQSAERGVRRDLVLERLLEVRGTVVSEDELQDAVKLIASQRRQDVGRFLQDMGDAWLTNYRFLLARDKAVRELVAELTGETLEADAEAAEDAAYGADAAALADEDEHGHDHHHHDHEGHHHH
ncbi:MAG TPA: trigger factor [Trueperaceae bacterium]|nr:trigger factor [Trueperaceae bacterium]